MFSECPNLSKLSFFYFFYHEVSKKKFGPVTKKWQITPIVSGFLGVICRPNRTITSKIKIRHYPTILLYYQTLYHDTTKLSSTLKNNILLFLLLMIFWKILILLRFGFRRLLDYFMTYPSMYIILGTCKYFFNKILVSMN